MNINDILKQDLYYDPDTIEGSAAHTFELNFADFKTYSTNYKNEPIIKYGYTNYVYSFNDQGLYEQPELELEEVSNSGYAAINVAEYYDISNATAIALTLVNRNDISTSTNIQDSFEDFINNKSSNGDNWKIVVSYKVGGQLEELELNFSMIDINTEGVLEIGKGVNFADETEYMDGSSTIFFNSDYVMGIGNIASNIPLFVEHDKALNFLDTGNASEAVNYQTTVTEDEPADKLCTWRQVLHRVDADGNNDEIVGYTNIIVRCSADSRICGYVTKYEEVNVRLTFSGTVKKIEYYNGETTTTLAGIADIEGLITWTDQDGHYYKDGNYYYWSKVNKYNWPIESSAKDAQDYVDKKKSSDDEKATPPNKTGSEKKDQTNDNNDSTLNNILSDVYIAEYSVMNKIALNLYNTSTSIIDQIKSGLQLFGNNAIDFIIDAYYLPIDVSDFISGIDTGSVVLGGLNVDVQGNRCTKLANNYTLKTMFSTFFYPTYNDFRDYQANYYLYLPFIGIFEVPASQILNKLVTCKCFFDVRSHNIKYYLFCDNKLLLTKEGSIGVQFPLVSSDSVGKSQQNITALENIAGSATDLAFNPTPSGAIRTAENMFNSTIQLAQRAKITTSGNSSSATACRDILYCYLIIDSPEYIKPENLEEEYGIPCNKIGLLGSCSGFTQANDIFLKGTMLQEEKDTIEALFNQGVIL